METKQVSNEHSKLHLTNARNQRKRWSTVKADVFGASSSLPPLMDRVGRLVGLQMKRPHYFLRILTPKSVEIFFSNHTLVALVQYSFLLLSGSVLFVVFLLNQNPCGGN